MQQVIGRALVVTVLLAASMPVVAVEQGDWLIRSRAIFITPDDDSGSVTGIAGSGVDVENALVPELDFSYFLTDRIAAELILATANHDLEGEGTLTGLGRIADIWHLPPTFLLQYHLPISNRIKPYVGVGVNYTIFYGEDADASLEGALGGPTSVDLDNSVGVAFQAGVDVSIRDNWFINLDVKYIDIDTDAELRTRGVTREVDVDIDPWIFGLGVGVRF